MKALFVSLFTASLLLSSTSVLAGQSMQSLSGLLGKKESAESPQTAASALQGTDIMALVDTVSENLGVTQKQSQGGIASIFNYVKGNLSGNDFSSLSDTLPGLNSLLSMVPTTGNKSGSAGTSSAFSGLLDKASEYSSSVKSVNDLKKQFEALGLTPEMISSFVSQISSYLQSEEDKQTQTLFRSGLDELVNSL